MSKYTADEVAAMAAKYNYPSDAIGYRHNKLYEMLVEHERRLRQEDEESRRDPVMEPKMGDRMIMPCGWEWVCVPSTGNYAFCHEKQWQRERRLFPSATIIRRREVQQ